MIKGLTITTENKKRNAKYLSNVMVGSIAVFQDFNFPDSWGTENWRKENFRNVNVLFHEEAGFFPVQTPAFDPSTQKLGSIFEDTPNKLFKYPIINLTAQEIQEIEDLNDDTVAKETENVSSSEGILEVKYIFKRLRKLLNKGTLTQNQFNSAEDLLFDALIPLNWGKWSIAKTRLDNILDPVNATLLSILNEIRDRVDYYILNGIRDEEN